MNKGEIYSYKGNQYKIVGFGRMKQYNGTGVEWVDAIIYSDVNDGWTYVRSKNDFESKFILQP